MSDVADLITTGATKRPRLDASGEERGRRLHPVWEYFTVRENNSMECLECGRTFKTTGSTTVCKHHLRSRHPQIFEQLAAEESKDWRMKPHTSVDVEAMDEAAMKRLWHTISKTGDFFDDEKLLIIEGVRDRPLIWSCANGDLGQDGVAVEAEFSDLAQHISTKLKDYSAKDVQHIWESLKEAYKCAKISSDDFEAEEEDEECAEQKKKFLNAMSFLDTVLSVGEPRSQPAKKKRTRAQKPTMVHESVLDSANQSILAAANFGCSDGNNNNNNDASNVDGCEPTNGIVDYDMKLFTPNLELDYLKRQFSTPTSFLSAAPPAGASFNSSSSAAAGPMDVFANFLKQSAVAPAQSLTKLTTMTATHNNNNNSNGGASSLLDLDEARDESSPLGALVVDLHRKLRQRNKLYKAMEFKKCVFNLISEFETELL